MSSPVNADTDDTPEPPPRSGLSKNKGAMLQFAGSKSEKKNSSQGLLSKYSKSGKGEIARKPYSDAVVRRVEKRRRRDADKDVQLAPRRSSNDSDSEERPSSSEGPPSKNQKPPQPVLQPMGLIPSILTFIDAHPSLPSTLSYYVQFLLNCFFAFCMMYVLYGVYSTIVNDINERAMMESSEIFAEIAACVHEFKENRCERETRVPHMETACNSWEKCMQRDPYKVGRSRLSAGMFAEIFNGFIEPMSLKAIVGSPFPIPLLSSLPPNFFKVTPPSHPDRLPHSNNRLLRRQQPNLRPLARQNPSPTTTTHPLIRATNTHGVANAAAAEPAGVLHAVSEPSSAGYAGDGGWAGRVSACGDRVADKEDWVSLMVMMDYDCMCSALSVWFLRDLKNCGDG